MVEVKTSINSINERMDGMDRLDGRMDSWFGTNYVRIQGGQQLR